jgi:deoxyribodipyrimidine photo-lyase
MAIVWWIKRDMRLRDNPELTAAVAEAERRNDEVVPVYVVEPSLRDAAWTGEHHLRAVLSALAGLRGDLRSCGAELLILRGELPAAFEEAALSVRGVHAEEETGPQLTYRRDRRMRAWARERGIALREHPRNGVIRGLVDRDRRMAVWESRMADEPLAPPRYIPMRGETRSWCAQTAIPPADELGISAATAAVQRVDEHSAGIVLESFLNRRGREYRAGISSPTRARHTGSRLSAHLAWGTVSLRSVIHRLNAREEEIRAARRSGGAEAQAVNGWLSPLRAFRSRLYWHDHFCQRLEREPEMEFRALNHAYEDVTYDPPENAEARLWAGLTGFPMVDATVRALTKTGFANFRMRAMLVSFATYALHIDWRRLRDPMSRIMLDYLPGIHISQLQMQAGVMGINTVRVYNPTKQLLDHDRECRFVRRFLPELRGFPSEVIIAHAVSGVDSPSHGRPGRDTAPAHDLRKPDGSLGEYPAAMLDFRSSVKSMQSEIYRRKRSNFGRDEARRVLQKHGSRRGGGARPKG